MTSLPWRERGIDEPRGADAVVNRLSAIVASVARVRVALATIAWARGAVLGISVVMMAWLLVGLALRRPVTPTRMGGLSVLVAALAIATLVRLRVGHIRTLRAALWMEEQRPSGYALVTLVECVMSRVNDADAARLARGVWARRSDDDATVLQHAVWRAARRALMGPVLFAAGLVALVAMTRVDGTASHGLRDGAATVHDTRNAPIGAWRVRVVSPTYTGRADVEAGDASTVQVLSGSELEIVGPGTTPIVTWRALAEAAPSGEARDSASPSASRQAVSVEGLSTGWRASARTTGGPAELRVTRGASSRLLLLDGYTDSLPRVELQAPLRDSVLRTPTGTLALLATLHDDIGLTSSAFELIVSSGDGEQFTARTIRVAPTRYGHGNANTPPTQRATLRTTLRLDTMALKPGDIIHLRAVARDAYPVPNRELGTSETRSFRVAKVAEYDSVAVEAAPPPEFDASLLSQRMLLLLTEKLEVRRPRLARGALLGAVAPLARDQTRLRVAVGDIVFQRLGGETEGAHSADHGGPPTGKADIGMLEEGDDSPVIAINRPLLEAYNAMWDAGRNLEQGDTKGAIPHMRVALAAIERSRAASRLYLRGTPPTVIVDVARIRLAGKDTGVSNMRTPRAALPPTLAKREARMLHAVVRARREPLAARDSVAVLRLESVSDAPDFVRALDALLEHLSRGGDITDAVIRARRTLGGIARVPMGAWTRAGVP